MPNQSPPTRYSAVAQGFHWLIAALIVLQFTLGWTAEDLPIGARKLARLDWHKSFGMTILMLAVLRLLSSKLSLREIGNELYVSLNTIKTHTRNIYAKLRVGSREQAVARAREFGLLGTGRSPG